MRRSKCALLSVEPNLDLPLCLPCWRQRRLAMRPDGMRLMGLSACTEWGRWEQ